MNRIETALRRIATDLASLGARWSLVGGLAVSARAEPRFTRDVDLALAVDGDPEAERIVNGLLGLGYRVLALVEQEAVGRLATARLSPPAETQPGVVVDLLFASSGIEGEVVAGAETLEVFAGVHLPVARATHLVALKILSRNDRTRPQDLADIRALLRVPRIAEDLEEVRESLNLMRKRGFQRDKDLPAEFERALRDAAEEDV